ncbi:MAG: LD-carboxypeptidase, partial [Thermoanaerobaculia bacterium]|nr:LD-carboxypeptidase [Thermoanaerobaculia bacterium]
MPTRREVIAALGATIATGALGSSSLSAQQGSSRSRLPSPTIVKPPRLTPGGVVGLVNPARAIFETEPSDLQTESIEALGLQTRKGENYFARRGYLAGTDQQRAD